MKKTVLFGLLVIILAFGFFGCGNKDEVEIEYPNNDAGGFTGTWAGMAFLTPATLEFSNSGWTFTIPSSYSETGNFNRVENSVTLYYIANNMNVGIAIVIDNNTIGIIFNQNSYLMGTYTMTRQ